MTNPNRWLALASVLTFTLGGCGSCQKTEEFAPGSGVRQAAPDPKAQSQATKPAVQFHPSTPAPGGTNDCFVFVDAEPDYGDAPLTAVFSTDLECGDKPVTYSWDFGDGSKGGNEPAPSHTYEKAGDYIATVTVKTADGAEGTDEIDIFVDEPGSE